MSSQDVVNFVRDRINSHEKLSSICEEVSFKISWLSV